MGISLNPPCIGPTGDWRTTCMCQRRRIQSVVRVGAFVGAVPRGQKGSQEDQWQLRTSCWTSDSQVGRRFVYKEADLHRCHLRFWASGKADWPCLQTLFLLLLPVITAPTWVTLSGLREALHRPHSKLWGCISSSVRPDRDNIHSPSPPSSKFVRVYLGRMEREVESQWKNV